MLPGQLIVVLMTLVFLLPGIALCFGKRWLVIDASNCLALDTITFLGIGRTRRVSLVGFERVRVAQQIKRNERARDSIAYEVCLVKRNGENFLVALSTSASGALSMGEKVASSRATARSFSAASAFGSRSFCVYRCTGIRLGARKG